MCKAGVTISQFYLSWNYCALLSKYTLRNMNIYLSFAHPTVLHVPVGKGL